MRSIYSASDSIAPDTRDDIPFDPSDRARSLALCDLRHWCKVEAHNLKTTSTALEIPNMTACNFFGAKMANRMGERKHYCLEHYSAFLLVFVNTYGNRQDRPRVQRDPGESNTKPKCPAILSYITGTPP